MGKRESLWLPAISAAGDLEAAYCGAGPIPRITVLGDWYANLVRAGRTQVVLTVSELFFANRVVNDAPACMRPPRLPKG